MIRLVLLGALCSGCGSQHETLQDTLPNSGPPGRTPARSSDAGDSNDVIETGGCPTSGQITYLLDVDGVLRTFDPTLVPTGMPFTTIGRLNCALPGGGAWAGAGNMTVDRSGVAWVSDVAGHLFEASTRDASCRPTAFQSGQGGFTKVGMSFVGSADGAETLYLVDNLNGPATSTGKGLGKVDLGTLILTPVANFDGPLEGHVAELAGTSDGRLFGFFPDRQSSVAEIDPSSAHILTSTPVAASLTLAGPTHIDAAVSLWGSVLYLYVAETAIAPSTNISVFDPATGTTRAVLSQIGFNVIGASVWTCAPASDG